MNLLVLATFFGLAATLSLIAAQSSDKTLLIPAGILLLLPSLFALTSPIQIQQGTDYTVQEISNDTVRTKETPTYTTLSQQTGLDQANQATGLTLLGLSLYLLFQGSVPRIRN